MYSPIQISALLENYPKYPASENVFFICERITLRDQEQISYIFLESDSKLIKILF